MTIRDKIRSYGNRLCGEIRKVEWRDKGSSVTIRITEAC